MRRATPCLTGCMADAATDRPGRLYRTLRLVAFSYLSAVLMVMASERVYWYWAGFTAESVLGSAAVYLIPVTAALWTLALASAARLHQVILGAAVYAFVTEGVVTPIIYADGPLPVLAAMFVGWHGLVALVGFWYLTRRWLLEGNLRRLTWVAAAFGVGWGVWAASSSAAEPPEPELIEQGFDPTVLSAGRFAVYAMAVGVTFSVAHWLIGFVWPGRWRPGRASTVLVVIAATAYMSLAVLPGVVWAPLKLAVFLGGTLWLLSKARRSTADEMSVFEELVGHVPIHRVAVLLIMPLGAAGTYAGVDALALTTDVLEGIYWTLVAIQVLAGGATFAWAAYRSLARTPAGSPRPSPDRRRRQDSNL